MNSFDKSAMNHSDFCMMVGSASENNALQWISNESASMWYGAWSCAHKPMGTHRKLAPSVEAWASQISSWNHGQGANETGSRGCGEASGSHAGGK